MLTISTTCVISIKYEICFDNLIDDTWYVCNNVCIYLMVLYAMKNMDMMNQMLGIIIFRNEICYIIIHHDYFQEHKIVLVKNSNHLKYKNIYSRGYWLDCGQNLITMLLVHVCNIGRNLPR